MIRGLSLLLLAFALACGGAPPSSTGETTPTAAASVDNLPLADFSIFTAVGAVEVRADGTLRENGTLVGTFSPDGAFVNVDGNEIGRLTPSGQIYFGGRLDAATIDATGTMLADPSHTIASFDPQGNLLVGDVTLEVRGYAPEKGRSILFAFAMYSALIAVAQRMQQEQQAPQTNGLH
ncbi:MAG: hypothetical protein H6721_07890 [Sandaracinus sp.]|nr:hypothetical protein [Myxococcales bacterium]MCB9598813.1 hypothetical protein [Sandaracinus sp.]MCB9632039.1 hypothetical protein [Sandaracinus sp.]